MTRNLLLVAAAFFSCAGAARADDWAYRAWIAKTGRVLTAGATLPDSRIDELAAKSPDEVIDALMAAPDFADTVLDFNLYFLGTKPAKLYTPDYTDATRRNYASEAFQNPQAIASAQAVAAGGDYLQVLDDTDKRFLTPFYQPEAAEPLAKFHAALDRTVAAFHPNGPDSPADKKAGCAVLNDMNGDSPLQEAQDALFDSGYFSGNDFSLQIAAVTMPNLDIQVSCFIETLPVDGIMKAIAAWRASIDNLQAVAPAFYNDAYAIHHLTDLRTLPNASSDPYLKGTAFDPLGFWNTYQNSSTNYNRKRAAHILRTYFCDDLTPLNVVPGDNSPHAGDAHASDPSCQSCHYKLDPMAGFFKDHGIIGYDFGKVPAQLFDDQAIFTGDRLANYRKAWPVTGYIRSTLNPQQNDYGESLPDLLHIIRRAPEVRQCLTRRLAEYTLGREQTVDGAWLDHLSQQFTVQPDSAKAFKSVLRELLLSKTFSAEDPQPDQCYDRYPDGAVSELPCAISFVIRTNCAGCHRGTDQRHGGLDLTHWTSGVGFPHLDENGQQRPMAETFARIQARLNTADPDQAMPLMRDMPAVEKARLYTWVTTQLTNGGAP